MHQYFQSILIGHGNQGCQQRGSFAQLVALQNVSFEAEPITMFFRSERPLPGLPLSYLIATHKNRFCVYYFVRKPAQASRFGTCCRIIDENRKKQQTDLLLRRNEVSVDASFIGNVNYNAAVLQVQSTPLC